VPGVFLSPRRRARNLLFFFSLRPIDPRLYRRCSTSTGRHGGSRLLAAYVLAPPSHRSFHFWGSAPRDSSFAARGFLAYLPLRFGNLLQIMAKNTRKSSFWEQKSADASRTVAVAISECRGHLAWPWVAVKKQQIWCGWSLGN
jgi:hypothetical protein